MRRFRDENGNEWDVVLGRESWGANLALFVPRGGGAPRQAVLPSSDYNAAAQQLERLGDDELADMLRGSVEKSE